MILSDPDAPKGIRTKALTEFVDIYPTLSDLCGLPVAKDLEGVSMVPLFEDPKRPWKKAAFSQYPRPKKMMGYSMRTERYRYTEWIDQQTNEVKYRELYDMTNDLLCKENIVFKPENGTLAASMHEMMKAGWQGAKP
jgi:arylsulfatase A-like enzyme